MKKTTKAIVLSAITVTMFTACPAYAPAPDSIILDSKNDPIKSEIVQEKNVNCTNDFIEVVR